MKFLGVLVGSLIALFLMSALLAWGLHSNLEFILGREFPYRYMWGVSFVLLAFFGPQNHWSK